MFKNICILHPSFDTLGHVVATADLTDKHDRSAPSDYHWKILKCRMIIFSHGTILASPDSENIKQVHIIFSKKGDDYDKLMSLFMKFSLKQEGMVREVTDADFCQCFQYTMLAMVAPNWNYLGSYYLINNRQFLTASGPQNGLQYSVSCKYNEINLKVKPIKLTLIKSKVQLKPGFKVRVLPSLTMASIEDHVQELPHHAKFKCYKDLKRHWKNIHGYRLPDEEGSYYLVRFWQGEPLTYPNFCVTTQPPIVVPVPKAEGEEIISSFVSVLQNKMNCFLGQTIRISLPSDLIPRDVQEGNTSHDTQAVSLCTPTQDS